MEFVGCLGGLALLGKQPPRRLAAAGDAKLAPRLAQPFIDRVHRQAEFARRGLGVMPAQQQPQGILLLFGQRVEAGGHALGLGPGMARGHPDFFVAPAPRNLVNTP